MEERRRYEEDKKVAKQVEAERKQGEMEMNIRVRKQNRQRSVQEMIERTRQVTAGILRPAVSNSEMPQNEIP